MKITSLKPFFISLIGQFLITALIYTGMHTPILSAFSIQKLLSQAPLYKPQSVTPDIFPQLLPKLNQTKSDFSLINTPLIIPAAQAASDYEQAAAYGVLDLDSGKVILSKNLNSPLPIASLTKVMAAVISLDLSSPDEQFTASDYAAQVEPTRMGVIPGQKYSVEELVNAMILTSANDAAQVLKEGVDQKYSQEVFIRAMNQKALNLGLKNSHFTNPQGYDSDSHYGSVADLMILSQYALGNYPIIKQAAQKDYQFYPASKNHKQIDLYNWNGLLGVYPGVYGLKIGNTDQAKYTTIVASTRSGKNLLVVLLGAPGVVERDLWASQLLDRGFFKTANLPQINVSKDQLKTKYATWKYWN